MGWTQQDNGDDDDGGGHGDGGHGRGGHGDGDHGDGDHGRVCVRACHEDEDGVDVDREHDRDCVDGCEHVNGRGCDHGLLCIVPGVDLACRNSLDTSHVG